MASTRPVTMVSIISNTTSGPCCSSFAQFGNPGIGQKIAQLQPPKPAAGPQASNKLPQLAMDALCIGAAALRMRGAPQPPYAATGDHSGLTGNGGGAMPL